MNEEEKFFKLLRYSNELNKKNQFLFKQDPETHYLLLTFLSKIENNLHFLEKQEYIGIASDLLNSTITAENFADSFIGIYEGINKKLSEMKKTESLELANFIKPDRSELGNVLAKVYGSCDVFSLDTDIALSDETELKECAQLLIKELQKNSTI